MQNKKLLISISLVMTVLFSILFQSLHTYEHFVKQFAEKECHHKKNNYGEPEITHQHHSVDACKVCHFSFDAYITPKVVAYKLISNYKQVPYIHIASDRIFIFSGSMYAHRGPPKALFV
jgi:hypothetical protein